MIKRFRAALVVVALLLTGACTTGDDREAEVPRSGHWLPEENPEFVTAELLTFFAGTPR